jgi:hypothetical protein
MIARHVMAACDQASSVVLASTDVDGHRHHARDSTRSLALLGIT